ncbi:hypothetical protein [Alteribacillus sp. HJP-4]|uniref:hypothetical protein n=1 Tax=Alteribacillus sp. HJP-4 TaxID=2775394 RepID=UPI0035CCD97D
MKKLALMVVSGLLMMIGFTFQVSAAEEEPEPLTSEQLAEINDALEDLRIEANEKLENGESDFTVSKDLSFGEDPIELTFEEGNEVQASNSSSNYSASVKNTAGFNFSHSISGTWTYSGGEINSVSMHEPSLTGALYGKSATQNRSELDPSIQQISSAGTFKALKYAPVEYKTNLVVQIDGGGNYRVIKATISS